MLKSVSIESRGNLEYLRRTILNPSVTQSMDALRLMLSNDHVPDCASWKKIEDCIRICTLSLLVAASLGSLVSLHSTVENLAGHDVHGILENDSLGCDWECGDWEWESRRRASCEIALGSICVSLSSISLALTWNDCSLKQCWQEGQRGCGGELHLVGARRGQLKISRSSYASVQAVESFNREEA